MQKRHRNLPRVRQGLPLLLASEAVTIHNKVTPEQYNKTISGKSSAGNRLFDSKGQANRALLNMRTSYNPRKLALNIKDYFADNPDAREVLIFKGKREISVTKGMINSEFIQAFMRIYYK